MSYRDPMACGNPFRPRASQDDLFDSGRLSEVVCHVCGGRASTCLVLGHRPLEDRNYQWQEAAAHRNDPASSKDAAQRVLPKAQAMRVACLDTLRTYGPDTSHGIAARLGCHWSDVARRMTELLAAGKVRRQEKTFANFDWPEILFRREYLTRPTPSGGKACVWFLV